jgi:rhomboid protease GluP
MEPYIYSNNHKNMAIGLTPKHIIDLPIQNLNNAQYLVLAVATAQKLNWNILQISAKGLIARTNNGLIDWNGEIRIFIHQDHVQLKSESTGSDMVDLGKNKKTLEAFLKEFELAKSTFSEEELLRQYTHLQNSFVTDDQNLLLLAPASTKQKVANFFSIFVPIKGYTITPILMDLNILVFILMVMGGADIFAPSTEILLQWGANFKPTTLAGEWWRLITCCFLHIGIIHLALNMFALLQIGMLLEPLLGKSRFLAAYLFTGLSASITSLWWHSNTVSAGASGAIFGMYGVFLALLTTNLIEKKERNQLLQSIAIFVCFNLIYGISGDIDNAAHIGGLLSGVLIGYALFPSITKHADQKIKYLTIVCIGIVTILGSFLVYKNTPNDWHTYENKMAEFYERQDKAMAVYKLVDSIPNDQVLVALQHDGIKNWEANIQLTKDIAHLDLPEANLARNANLQKYSTLRLDSYRLLYKAIAENTHKYDTQLDQSYKRIDEVLVLLNKP